MNKSKRIVLIAGILLAGAAFIFMLIITAAYLLTPQLTRYHSQLVNKLSDVLQHPVTVEKVAAEWEGLGPVVQLHNVQIWDTEHQNQIINMDDVEVRVSIIDLVRKRTLVPRAVMLDNMQVTLKQDHDGDFEIVGFSQAKKKTDIYETIEKIIALDDIEINNAEIEIHLANGEITSFKNADFRLSHGRWRAHMDLSGTLEDSIARGKVTATATFSPRALAEKNWRGDLNVTLNSANLPSWMALWPHAPVMIHSGSGDITFESSWDQNELTGIYTALALEHLSVQQKKSNHVSSETHKEPFIWGVTSITGKVDGSKNEEGWKLAGDSAVTLVSGGDISSYGNIQLLPAIGDSHIELYAQGNNIPAVTTLDTYLPIELASEEIPAGFIKWLHDAIRGGTVEKANMVLRGPLSHFPFIDHGDEQTENLFEVTADVVGGDLLFHPDWLPVEKVQGKLVFRGNEFIAIIDEGEIAGGRIEQAAVVVPQIKRAGLEVDINGKLKGTAENTILFLQKSPLWPNLQEQLSTLDLKGPVGVELDLTVPITEPRAEPKILGAVNFDGTTVTMPAWNLKFTQVLGKLTFDHEGLYTDQLSAVFYDKPVTAQIATQIPTEGTPNFVKIAMQGDISVAGLQQLYPSTLWNDWSGTTPFAVEAEWRKANDKIPSRFQITSSMRGLNLNLPAPLNKPATQEQAFVYLNEFGGGHQHQQLTYGKLLRADLYLTTNKNQMEVTRGLVEIQPASTMPTPAHGLQVIGNFKTLDLDAWLPYLNSFTSSAGSSISLPAVSGKLKMDSLKMLGQNLAVNTVNLQRTSQQWNINFSGNDAHGNATVPNQLKQKPINIAMDYLNWTSGEPTEITENTPPDNFPNFNVNIKKLTWNGTNRGTLKLSTTMGNKVMNINPLKLDGPNYNFSATGQWRWTNQPATTSMQGTVTSKNLGGMLSDWGLTKGMQGGKGTTKFNLSWDGGPNNWNLEDLSGQMAINWTNGRLTEVNPGIGRVLSLLNFNMQGISRRLRLDFSDLFKQGFTFDRITSDMTFKPGVVKTKNGEVDSTVGKIIFNGEAYTVTKTVDLYVDVYPGMPSSLPIAGAVAVANPIVGVGVWVAEKVVSPAISKTIASRRYHVTGPWQEPIINEAKGKSSK